MWSQKNYIRLIGKNEIIALRIERLDQSFPKLDGSAT